MAKILVTGGAGFIGSNFIRYWLKTHPADEIVNLDLLTYSASIHVSSNGKSPRLKFVKGDICSGAAVRSAMKGARAVIHFAAETHVDRSIHDSQIFLSTNVLGTQNLLETARSTGTKKFIFISTDEVYGSIQDGCFDESSPLKPNSPYAASKAAADLLCRSYWKTYGTPVIVTRCCNNFGPYQFPEKVIPLFITNLMEGKQVPVYGDGSNVREWIHVEDHCRAIDRIYQSGEPGEIYNIGSGDEIVNLDLARTLINHFGKTNSAIKFVKDRPGHDFRYSLNSSKLRNLGWRPATSFKKALAETVDWYRENRAWWGKIKSRPQYKKYIAKQYTH